MAKTGVKFASANDSVTTIKSYNKQLYNSVIFTLSKVSHTIPVPYLLTSFLLILTDITLQFTKVTSQSIRQFDLLMFDRLFATCKPAAQFHNSVILTYTDNSRQKVHMEQVHK